RAVSRRSQELVVWREVIAELGIAPDTDLFIPPFADRYIADSSTLFKGFRFPLLFLCFQLDPLIDGDLFVFEQKVFELAGQRRGPCGTEPPQHHYPYPAQSSTGRPHSLPFRTRASRRRKENMRRPLQPGYGCLRYWLTCTSDGVNNRQDY